MWTKMDWLRGGIGGVWGLVTLAVGFTLLTWQFWVILVAVAVTCTVVQVATEAGWSEEE